MNYVMKWYTSVQEEKIPFLYVEITELSHSGLYPILF